MKNARQQEHFKQDASPAGETMLRPPVEAGAPGNLHKARRDKTDSLESQTMKYESKSINEKTCCSQMFDFTETIQ